FAAAEVARERLDVHEVVEQQGAAANGFLQERGVERPPGALRGAAAGRGPPPRAAARLRPAPRRAPRAARGSSFEAPRPAAQASSRRPAPRAIDARVPGARPLARRRA